MLIGVFFVPTYLICSSLAEIFELTCENNLKEQFCKRKEYSKNTYCGYVDEFGKFRGVKNIGPSFWTAYLRVLEGIPLTSNGAEALNRSLNLKVT
jgi:hypothetical protein